MECERKDAPDKSGGLTMPPGDGDRWPPSPGYPQCPGGPIDPPVVDPRRIELSPH